MNVFAKYQAAAWPYRYEATILARDVHGGTPAQPNVAEAWLRTKFADKDELIAQEVVALMEQRGITADEAIKEADLLRHLNGFKRNDDGQLCLEGRHLKAAIKEAVSICVAAGKLPKRGWGETNKGALSFAAEHIQVEETLIPLGVTAPTNVDQRFVHTFRGTGIQYEERIEEAKLDFTVSTDVEFPTSTWAMIWLTAGAQGIGASRSQGFGRFDVVRWDKA